MRTEILVYPQVTAIQNMNFISNMVKVFELQFCTVGWGYFLARLIALYSKAFFYLPVQPDVDHINER